MLPPTTPKELLYIGMDLLDMELAINKKNTAGYGISYK